MESVCNKFNCPDMAGALKEGFKAYCEAYAAGDPSPIWSTPKERLDRFHNYTTPFRGEQPYKDKVFTPEQYKKYLKRDYDSHAGTGNMINGYNNDKWHGYGYVRPEKHHKGRLEDYINDRALKPTEEMFERQYDNVVEKSNELIRKNLGDLSRYIHSFDAGPFCHVWKYEGPDEVLELSYNLSYKDITDYIDDGVTSRIYADENSAKEKNYHKAVDEYLKEDLNKPIGRFVLKYNRNYFIWKDTNDITSPGENKRSPLSMLTIYTNLLYDKGAREEGDENTKEFWLNRMDEGLYDPETDMS